MGEMGVWVEKYNTLSYETKITEKGLSFSFFFFSVFGERRSGRARAGGSLSGGSHVYGFLMKRAKRIDWNPSTGFLLGDFLHVLEKKRK